MKKIYSAALLFFSLLSSAFSQQRIWSREQINFGKNSDSPILIATDKSENVCLVNYFPVNGNNTLHYRVHISKYNRGGQKLWEKVYQSAADKGNYFQHVKSLLIDDDENIYIGLTSLTANGSQFLLVKYSATGNFLWERAHKGNSKINSLMSLGIDADNFIYVAGTIDVSSAVSVLKYSKNGDLIWNKKYDGQPNTNTPFDMHIDGTGNVLLTGYADDPDPNFPADTYVLTLKYSPNGDLLWSKLRKGGPESNYGVKVLTDKDNSVYVMYHQSDGVGVITESNGGIIKYDVQGNEEWIVQGIKLENMVMDSAANLYVGNSQSLTKFNAKGQKLWEKIYDANDDYVTSSLYFPMHESMALFPETETVLMALTTSGNQQFTKTFAFKTENGDIAWSDAFETPDRRNRNIAVADSAFYTVSGSGYNEQLSLVRYSLKNEQVQPPGIEPFAIFPNPTDGIVQVQGAPKSYDMLIADEHGKILQRGTVPSGNSTVSFSVFAPGMYILQLTDGEDKIVKKIIRNR